MELRISIVCLGVKDLARALTCYRDGLGLPTTRTAADGIIFFPTQGTCLELFSVRRPGTRSRRRLSG